jgi:hypothetical protein
LWCWGVAVSAMDQREAPLLRLLGSCSRDDSDVDVPKRGTRGDGGKEPPPTGGGAAPGGDDAAEGLDIAADDWDGREWRTSNRPCVVNRVRGSDVGRSASRPADHWTMNRT